MGKPSPRFDGMIAYKDGKADIYDAEIRRHIHRQIPESLPQINCPVRLDILAMFSRTKKLREQYVDGTFKHGLHILWQAVKPDWDNVGKGVGDAITQCRLETMIERARRALEAELAARAEATRYTVTKAMVEGRVKETPLSKPWKDDGRVSVGTVTKVYVAIGRSSGLVLRLRELREGPERGPERWIEETFGEEILEELQPMLEGGTDPLGI